jgi:hypothetical protein
VFALVPADPLPPPTAPPSPASSRSPATSCPRRRGSSSAGPAARSGRRCASAWTRWTLVGATRPTLERVRLARSAPAGGAWQPTRELGIGDRGSEDSQTPARVGLAVTPGGRTLVAWTNDLNVARSRRRSTTTRAAT